MDADYIFEEDQYGGNYGSESAAPRRAGRRGRLAGLLDLPIDVLFEIFGHLPPYDLLRVSRTTKEFRRLLMRSSAVSLWRTTFDRAPSMPPRPTDMNEPQWAHLVFDPHCHICYAPNVRSIAWEWRMRICVRCMREHTVDRDEDYIVVELPPLGEIYLVDVVYSRAAPEGGRKYLVDHLENFDNGFNVLTTLYDQATYVNVCQTIVAERAEHASQCEVWLSSQQFNRQQEQDRLREERLDDIVTKLNELGWGSEWAVLSDEDVQDFINHPLIKKAQKLTPRVWTNIQEFVLKYMEDARDRRLTFERECVTEARSVVAAEVLRQLKNLRLPQAAQFPNAIDFCKYGTVWRIVDQPGDAPLTGQDFVADAQALNHLLDYHSEKIKRRFIEYICAGELFRQTGIRPEDQELEQGFEFRESLDARNDWNIGFPGIPNEEAYSKIKLASTVFSCSNCLFKGSDSILPWPEVMDHRCTCTKERWNTGRYLEPIACLESSYRERIAWTPYKIRIDYRFSHSAASIISAAGKDVLTTTPEEMDGLNDRFVCLICAFREEYRSPHGRRYQGRALAWREAVYHFATHHCRREPDTPQWQRMSEQEVMEAYRYGERVLNTRWPRDPSNQNPFRPVEIFWWRCTHCRDMPEEPEPMEMPQMVTHLQEKHDEANPTVNVDYFLAPGYHQNPGLVPCPVMLREEEMHDDVDLITFPTLI